MAIAQEVILAGKFLSESLVKYETELTETIYPELWAYNGMYHEAIDDLPFGCLEYTNARIEYTGRGVNFGGRATTVPLANFGINMDRYRCLGGILAAEWTWQELRTEEVAQQNQFLPKSNIVSSYRKALEKGLQEWIHIRSVYGDTEAGFTGLINNPYVEVISVSAANNGVTGPSADAISSYDWFRSELSNFRKASRLTAEGTAVLTSEDVSSALERRFADNSNDGTPADLLMGTSTGRNRPRKLQTMAVVNEMSGSYVRDPQIGNMTSIAGVPIADTDDLVLMFDSTIQNNIVKHFADIDVLPAGLLDDQLTYRQVGMCATSEVMFNQPFRARLYVLKRS